MRHSRVVWSCIEGMLNVRLGDAIIVNDGTDGAGSRRWHFSVMSEIAGLHSTIFEDCGSHGGGDERNQIWTAIVSLNRGMITS